MQGGPMGGAGIGAGNASTGAQSARQIINSNAELLSIFGGQEKIQFHQIMEKLSEHLFEVDPIEIDFTIGEFKQDEDQGNERIQRMLYRMPVDCFSPN